MSEALKKFKLHQTPQTTRARADQVKNYAGGYVFTITDKERLERFLILGVDGGTYYVGEQEFTQDNVDFLVDLIHRDETLVAETVQQVSMSGRAKSNSPAIFAFTVLLATGKNKAVARAVGIKVVRTATHLFEFAQYVENIGGWGRAKTQFVKDWYAAHGEESLAYQVVKYRQRNGWTHRDMLRLGHPFVPPNIGQFILGKVELENLEDEFLQPDLIRGFIQAQAAGTKQGILSVLQAFPGLPWEALPTEFLNEPEVWKKLFYNKQLNGQALVRNITRLSRIGAFDDMSFTNDYAERLVDKDMIRRTRLHPTNYLNALVVHTEGQMDRKRTREYYIIRNKNWDSVPRIVDALNAGFYESFRNIEPANKRTLLAIDVSSSMAGNPALGSDLSAAQVSGAIAMTIARSEPQYTVKGFSTEFRDLGISPSDSLRDIMHRVRDQNFGGTDISLPMLWALQRNVAVETFVVITDNETWAGRQHPFQALMEYRQRTGIPARLAVMGVTSTGFTIADPNDKGSMDFVGFDSNAPRVLADFSAGRL